MKLIPMGEYYVWHCDWCDSANHLHWSSMEMDGLTCAACLQRAGNAPGKPAGFSRYPAAGERHAGALYMG